MLHFDFHSFFTLVVVVIITDYQMTGTTTRQTNPKPTSGYVGALLSRRTNPIIRLSREAAIDIDSEEEDEDMVKKLIAKTKGIV